MLDEELLAALLLVLGQGFSYQVSRVGWAKSYGVGTVTGRRKPNAWTALAEALQQGAVAVLQFKRASPPHVSWFCHATVLFS